MVARPAHDALRRAQSRLASPSRLEILKDTVGFLPHERRVRMRAYWLTVAFVAITCIHAPAGSYLWLQHAPTMAALPILAIAIRRKRLTTSARYGCLIFTALHAIGARWIYSYVPYDFAISEVFGTDTEQLFGWQRNHYDRLVHFMYGVCFVPLAWQLHSRASRHRLTLAWLSIEWVLASSALYEVAEWLAAITLAPDWAESYLGQQGDIWDPIKDMALAGAGAVLAAASLACWQPKDSIKTRRESGPVHGLRDEDVSKVACELKETEYQAQASTKTTARP